MERDLIERLRDPDYAGPMQHLRSSDEIDRLFNSAADRIEALERENATLRAERDEARRTTIEEAAQIARTFGTGTRTGEAIAAAIRNMGGGENG